MVDPLTHPNFGLCHSEAARCVFPPSTHQGKAALAVCHALYISARALYVRDVIVAGVHAVLDRGEAAGTTGRCLDAHIECVGVLVETVLSTC